MEFTITSTQILGICALVTAIWGVYKIIKEITKPNEDLKRQVADNTEKIQIENAELEEIKRTNKMLLQGMLVLINHDITGNGIDKLKEARDELQEYLINK